MIVSLLSKIITILEEERIWVKIWPLRTGILINLQGKYLFMNLTILLRDFLMNMIMVYLGATAYPGQTAISIPVAVNGPVLQVRGVTKCAGITTFLDLQITKA